MNSSKAVRIIHYLRPPWRTFLSLACVVMLAATVSPTKAKGDVLSIPESHAPDSTRTYEVPLGSMGNQAILVFAAPVSGMYTARVVNAPAWVEPDASEVEVTVEIADEAEVVVVFSVVEDAPVGEAADLVIDVFGPDGQTARKVIRLSASAPAPATLALEAYPNPFAESARVVYDLPTAAEVELAVYDVLGRRVLRLAGGEREAGRHTVELRGLDLAAGTYVVRLQAESDGGRQVLHRRITHIR